MKGILGQTTEGPVPNAVINLQELWVIWDEKCNRYVRGLDRRTSNSDRALHFLSPDSARRCINGWLELGDPYRRIVARFTLHKITVVETEA